MTLIDTIVVPQGAEYQAVCRGLNRGQVEDVRVIKIPIGTKNLPQILQEPGFWAANPQKILLMGLGGSLTPQYSVGDILLYQSCINLAGQQVDLAPELNQLIQSKISPQLVTGLTSDRPITSVAAKIQLNQKYSAMAIDMESYDYIRELQAKGIVVASIRVVSDDLRGKIPNLSQGIDSAGNLKVGGLAIAFAQQPFAALRLIKGSLQALKVLEQVTYQLFSK